MYVCVRVGCTCLMVSVCIEQAGGHARTAILGTVSSSPPPLSRPHHSTVFIQSSHWPCIHSPPPSQFSKRGVHVCDNNNISMLAGSPSLSAVQRARASDGLLGAAAAAGCPGSRSSCYCRCRCLHLISVLAR